MESLPDNEHDYVSCSRSSGMENGVFSILPDDIYSCISHVIDHGPVWKTWIQLSRRHYRITLSQQKTNKLRFANPLWSLIKMFPDKPWDWCKVWKSKYTSRKRIESRLEDDDYCSSAISYPWSWDGVTLNPNISIDKILESIWADEYLETRYDWSWELLSYRSDLKLDHFYLIKNNLNFGVLSRTINESWRKLMKHKKASRFHAVDYSTNPNFKYKDVLMYPDEYWNFYEISKHKNVTWQIICDNPDGEWYWDDVAMNPNITWDIICANPEKFGDHWDFAARNPNITWKNVKSKFDWEWNIKFISKRANVTWDDVLEQPNIWNWDKLSKNPSITWDIICANPDRPWNWRNVSRNPSITWADIAQNPDRPWCWQSISGKLFSV